MERSGEEYTMTVAGWGEGKLARRERRLCRSGGGGGRGPNEFCRSGSESRFT